MECIICQANTLRGPLCIGCEAKLYEEMTTLRAKNKRLVKVLKWMEDTGTVRQLLRENDKLSLAVVLAGCGERSRAAIEENDDTK